jgi:Co/Zn/Cd efflux system component
MSADCCSPAASDGVHARYRRILWLALGANLAMFFIEVMASALSGSSSLAADALDFLGDSANYAASLGAIALGGLWTSRVAFVKGLAMFGFGVVVLAYAAWRAVLGVAPEPFTMGAVALAALGVNLGVAALLFRYRKGDANMRSVWLCTRNDVIANLAVIAAAVGVFGTGSLWPDFAVAAVLAVLGVTSGAIVIEHARLELVSARPARSIRYADDTSPLPPPGRNAGGEGAIAVSLPYRAPYRDSPRRLPMHQPRSPTR